MTSAGGGTTIEAMQAGAVDVIEKPVDKTGFLAFRASLPAKVRAAFACHRSEMKVTIRENPTGRLPVGKPGIVAIGSSTGGTEALETILRQASEDCPGFVIAQHIPAKFSLMFATRLGQVCRIEVKEAASGDLIRPGIALIAPGDHHMVVQRRTGGLEVSVNQGPRIGFQRPSVDMLFRSVAAVTREEAVGVILTGMGNDGAAGLLEMKRNGALTIAQDETTCAVFGMPREAIRIGAVDHVLSIGQIAATLGRLHATSSEIARTGTT